MDPAIFYPDSNVNGDLARSLCAACPVATQCREAGQYEEYGIWGGIDATTRRRARRPPEPAPTSTNPRCGTLAGYARHSRRYEQACRACLDAKSAYTMERARARRASTAVPQSASKVAS